jgi:hypothetical protein
LAGGGERGREEDEEAEERESGGDGVRGLGGFLFLPARLLAREGKKKSIPNFPPPVTHLLGPRPPDGDRKTGNPGKFAYSCRNAAGF